ncbi:SusD/RagB family nutrient-binding outer membrane lipoprotein [Chryseolinea lacunae]|uniref:SusD/RagB family nutrient-binding outer membrane lipoprotein n=1 Tax=Chryseolinea lacunae TaxID=2801331 RepID=A0ABS1L0N6_9BACT|nr:SusD/RagB family nutrient-binding outer membrane lipoprotein [Chryseolinea lacunae]MBL0745204.1 SusD/RagB family nutrient-binding outer membrane lipoprotein [Chryseolinea lacunae]
MKKYIKSFPKIALLLALGAFISSCEKFANGVSEFDPTKPTDASLKLVVNAAQISYVAYMEGELARIGGMWSGQFTGTDRQYVALNNYTSTAPDYDNAWSTIYSSLFKSLKIAEAKATLVNNKRALAMMQILEAHTMGTTAALFGDIPYSQASNLSEYPNPVFDDQRDIYNALITLVDQALKNIDEAPDGTNYDGDLFFPGQKKVEDADALWTAVAYTVKAKLYLNLSDYPNALQAAAKGISNPSGDVMIDHHDSPGQDFNLYYSFLVYDRPGYMGAADAFAPKMLDATSPETFNRNNDKNVEDDRFAYIYYGNYEDGYDLNVSGFDYDGEADGMFSNRAPFRMLTYRDNQLILAEATLRQSGFTAALDELNEYRAYLDAGGYLNPDYYSGPGNYQPYASADFDEGGSQNPDGITAADALYREITEERYVSLLSTLDVFIDMHRKGFGSFAGQQNWQVIGLTPVTGTLIPQRFLIPQSEVNSNTSAPKPSPGLFDPTELFN